MSSLPNSQISSPGSGSFGSFKTCMRSYTSTSEDHLLPWPDESCEKREFPLLLDKVTESSTVPRAQDPALCVSQSAQSAVTEYHKQPDIYFSQSWRVRCLRSGHQQISWMGRACFLACRWHLLTVSSFSESSGPLILL